MATAQRDRDIAQLREAIEHVADSVLKEHMLTALTSFTQRDALSDSSSDPVIQVLRSNDVTTKTPRDALVLAVHAILMESGFQVQNATANDAFPLPSDWDSNSTTGLFTFSYKHPNDITITFNLQCVYVGAKCEVYISDDKEHTHSIELSLDSYVALSSTSSNAGDVLRDLATLRQKLSPFLENVAPKRPSQEVDTTRSNERQQPTRSPPDAGIGGSGRAGPSSPYVIPPVGSGDIVPPGLGGGDPSTEVGPNHPIFGRRYDPTRGPVPGARFDPYGPFSPDPQGPPRGFVGGPHPFRPGPAPSFPFGDPNPDHLRMPRDDRMDDDPFAMGDRMPLDRRGQGRGGRGMSGGFGSDFSSSFGSGGSFF